MTLLPVIITVIVLGFLLRAGGGATGGATDEVVAGFAIGLGNLVVRSARLTGLQEAGICGGLGGGGSGSFRLVGDLRSRRGVSVVVRIVVPANFFILFDAGALAMKARR